jgi:hypothetical protein
LKKTRLLNGYIRSVADNSHPLQTKLSLVLTDFDPNDNKQGVPITEKERFIKSAFFMPLKIDFDGEEFFGHDGAIPVGPIIDVREEKDKDGREIIVGDAIVWNEVYPDISTHLKEVFAEGVGTSWELYYQDSELDTDGVEWLHGVLFAGTAVVKTPAYGPNRTRILAIAEKIKDTMTVENTVTADSTATWTINGPFTTTGQPLVLQNGTTQKLATAEENDLLDRISELCKHVLHIDEFDSAKASDRIDEVLSAFVELNKELDLAKAELNELKTEKAEKEAEAAKQEKLIARKNTLNDAGINFSEEDWTKREAFFLGMEDATFTTYVDDLRTAMTTRAERKAISLPEPVGVVGTKTIKDLAKAFKEVKN